MQGYNLLCLVASCLVTLTTGRNGPSGDMPHPNPPGPIGGGPCYHLGAVAYANRLFGGNSYVSSGVSRISQREDGEGGAWSPISLSRYIVMTQQFRYERIKHLSHGGAMAQCPLNTPLYVRIMLHTVIYTTIVDSASSVYYNRRFCEIFVMCVYVIVTILVTSLILCLNGPFSRS